VEENKKKVKQAIKNQKINIAVTTDWPFIGNFMKFIEKTGVMFHLKSVTGTQKRIGISLHLFILLYLLKTIIGIPKIRGSEVLLGNVGAMNLIGFRVEELINGTTKRGKANQHGKRLKKNTASNGCIYASG